MKHKLFAIIATIMLLITTLVLPVSAVDESNIDDTTTVSPRYVNIRTFSISCSVNTSGKALCYSNIVTANSTYTIYLDLNLQQYKNGSWSTIKTWEGSGTGSASLDKSRYVTSGYYYRTAATATVYTSGGSYVESATIYSQSDYY